jgi:hypothetical protein
VLLNLQPQRHRQVAFCLAVWLVAWGMALGLLNEQIERAKACLGPSMTLVALCLLGAAAAVCGLSLMSRPGRRIAGVAIGVILTFLWLKGYSGYVEFNAKAGSKVTCNQ